VERSRHNVEGVELSNNPAEAALARLERVTEHFRREIHLALRTRGMTLTQYNVLRTLYSEGSNGLTCSELGSRLAGADRISRACWIGWQSSDWCGGGAMCAIVARC
jgi:hypothetical protein